VRKRWGGEKSGGDIGGRSIRTMMGAHKGLVVNFTS
jgi:hypothetical protein